MIQLLPNKQLLQLNKNTLKQYLQMKMNEEDWHGVADAAMDLREIEVLLKEIAKREEFDRNTTKIDPQRNLQNVPDSEQYRPAFYSGTNQQEKK